MLDAITKRTKTVRAYRDVFNSEEGKLVLSDLCKSCHVFHSTFDTNPNETYYREGERSVVLRILRTLEVDPFELEKQLKGQSN